MTVGFENNVEKARVCNQGTTPGNKKVLTSKPQFTFDWTIKRSIMPKIANHGKRSTYSGCRKSFR